jgi:N-ethylmaleimide reductase
VYLAGGRQRTETPRELSAREIRQTVEDCRGVRLSPYWTGGLFTVDELDRRSLAYLHLRAPDAGPDFGAFARYRPLFGGPLIRQQRLRPGVRERRGRSRDRRRRSYARHFVANPDLVTPFALGRELVAGDPATYYSGGITGYLEHGQVAVVRNGHSS